MKKSYYITVCQMLILLILPRFSIAQGLLSATPEQVGMSSARLARITPVMQKYVDSHRIPGCVTLIARHGKIVHMESYGQTAFGTGEPMTENIIFRIASMTKPITAVAAMMLYEEGCFLLSDPIGKYIKEFSNMQVIKSSNNGDSFELVPAQGEITIRHLLNHTSGITYGSGKLSEFYTNAGVSSGLQSTDGMIGDMVKKLAGLPLQHNPGEEWSYGLSNDVIGYFIEIVSGMTLDEFFRERIFKPLRMNDTYFFPPDEKLSRLATYYIKNKNGGLDRQSQESVDAMYTGPHTYFSGGGGLCSTVKDYARFSQMLLNGGELDGVRILSRKTVELMTHDTTGGIDILRESDDTRATHGDRYGFGVGIRFYPGDIESVGTFGWGGAYHTLFWIDPKEELIGIFMSQIRGEGDKSQHRKFRILTYQAIID
ncbi:MAG: beta-lactamase family protein [Candidatus Latescibacteria bacterium]|nr:beta-lactamase family protein [Candidatus Latescibacterota bacterium]